MSRKSRTSNQANTEKTGEVDAYHIESVIGEGAFATVTLCKRTKDAKIFAAKMIRFENSRRMKWETENEIEVFIKS